MSQTDRQTDKSTNWAVTAYNAEIALLENAKSYPSYVKKVFGGREICPTSGKEHFQGHIQLHTQQRLSCIKKWLPTAHLEIARNFKASVAYAMKNETSSGAKNEVVNPRPFIDNQTALKMLAVTDIPVEEFGREVKDLDDHHFWPRVRIILKTQPHLCGLFGKPDIYRMWKHTASVWFYHVSEEGEAEASRRHEGTIVLQSPTIIEPSSINGSESGTQASPKGSGTEADDTSGVTSDGGNDSDS